jgi:hypothetical protein
VTNAMSPPLADDDLSLAADDQLRKQAAWFGLVPFPLAVAMISVGSAAVSATVSSVLLGYVVTGVLVWVAALTVKPSPGA